MRFGSNHGGRDYGAGYNNIGFCCGSGDDGDFRGGNNCLTTSSSLAHSLGRRWCLFLYSLASGFALLSVLILHITGNVDVLPSLVMGLALFGKIGVTASMAIIFIVATEMYPTVTR